MASEYISFSQEVFDELCVYLSMGESLRTACKHEGMPNKSSVLRWLAKMPELRNQYVRSKEEGADAIAEETFDIADEFPLSKEDGSVDGGYIQYARHRTDIRKWYLSKIAPKKYGDKVTSEHTGPNGGPLLTRDVSELTDAELAALVTGDK